MRCEGEMGPGVRQSIAAGVDSAGAVNAFGLGLVRLVPGMFIAYFWPLVVARAKHGNGL